MRRAVSPRPAKVLSSADPTTTFVIVCAQRTGSTMLVTMLNQHPDIVCGSEVLNDVWIDEGGPIDWSRKSRHYSALERDAEVHRLRREDPIAFLGRLRELAAEEGYRVVGFKLLYGHGELRPHVVEYLAGEPSLRVIHLVREHRLRRLLSMKRGERTGEWSRPARGADVGPRVAVRIGWLEMLEDFAVTERSERAAARVFERRPILRLRYEDLLRDERGVAAAVARFLGVEIRDIRPRTRQQGGDALASAIENFEELRQRATGSPLQWMFDDG